MTVVVVLCSHSRLWAVMRVYFTLRGLQSRRILLLLARCVHSSVNKPGANGRVSYDSLTHSRLYCRDRRKSRSWIKTIKTQWWKQSTDINVFRFTSQETKAQWKPHMHTHVKTTLKYDRFVAQHKAVEDVSMKMNVFRFELQYNIAIDYPLRWQSSCAVL